MQHYAKVLAIFVRNEIEDFHIAHLSDKQMKELNPLIRNSLYNALHCISHYAYQENAKAYYDFQVERIPDYWEDPKLNSFLKKKSAIKHKPPQFKSDFLKEQLNNGNLTFDEKLNIIYIEGSYNFKNVADNKRHALRNKITNILRKEGFVYVAGYGGYMKPKV